METWERMKMRSLLIALGAVAAGTFAIPGAATFFAGEAATPPAIVQSPPDDETVVPSNPTKDVFFGECTSIPPIRSTATYSAIR